MNSFIHNAIKDRLFPGCVLAVSNSRWEGEPFIRIYPFGKITYAPWSPDVNPVTIFDLASLTKPLSTALTILALVSRGKIALDEPISDFFKEQKPGNVTIRHLLSHTSGLPAYRPFYPELLKAPSVKKKALLTHLLFHETMGERSETFGKAVYSDLGFMLLDLIIEKVTGMDLGKAVKKLVFEPLSIDGLFFPPLSVSQIAAPTQFCPYRKKVIMGETHDLNAWAMGGFSGHAGLFGTAGGVCALLKKLLDIYKGRSSHPVFKKELVSKFFKRQDMDKESTWALGFDSPSPKDSSAGRYFSPESVGHLGYTGTSFWMDLRNEVIIVFLSNRTFPHDTEESRLRMKRFRPAIHDMIMEEHL